ncbi:nucleoporin protein Ndc1-Nup-domain-containing protein [Mycena capillaripes]|nr:nucleoporin protein Ndc1-Nup-domain-containing protein [Mycena capillaripes]
MASTTPRVSGVPTPIRAITTPLRSSVAPPIPPASQLYEPLAKAVLRRRLTNRIFPYTLLGSVAGTALFLVFNGSFALTRLLGASVALWVGGVLPVILLRKAYLTVTHTSAHSPLLLVKKSLAPPLSARTTRAMQTHVASAVFTLAVHTVLDPTLPVFIKSRKHPYTPHPVLVLLALSQSILATLYVLRAVLRDVWVFPFRRPTLTPSPSGVLAPVFLALFAPFVALLILFVIVPILRWVPIVSLLLRPIRHPHLSVLRSLPRAWFLGVQTAWTWEAAAGVWGWTVGEPLHTTPTIRALVSGISVALTHAPVPSASAASSAFSTPSSLSPSLFLSRPAPATPAPSAPAPPPSIYTHLAYAELLALASSPSPSPARGEAFDIDGTVWGRLVREALVLLGREYQQLLARGAPHSSSPPLTAHASPPSAHTAKIAPAGTPLIAPSPLHKTNIFAPKKTPPSPAARVGSVFASGSALEEIVTPAVSQLPPVPIPRVDEHVQRFWAQVAWVVEQAWGAFKDAVWIVFVPGWVRGVYYALTGMAPGVVRVWTKARKGREVGGWVPRREVVVEAVGVLTHLTCASLTEDRFGVVQRDIPRVLEALTAFLGAVEDAQGALRGDRDKEDERDMEQEKDLADARAVLGEVGDALKDGIARIARTFGDKLRAFRFPPRTAARLQGFLEYHG